MRRRGSGHFQGTSKLHNGSYLLHGLFQQKGNRCAVMSTVDYSCNIARKSAPPQVGRLEVSVKKPASILSISILPEQQTQPEQLAASCSAPQTENQPRPVRTHS
ncbi:hypothetical protein EYF80_001234 [Xyrichtys novacula]|uniref:Uncharacterized protein n=1 Tax=Xyrichtys novacula TaxID=13765 RepID=A0AAV1GHM4_XYRNO|nr:hypothetical protein EYF80_001234 [Xyrichtys novacula]